MRAVVDYKNFPKRLFMRRAREEGGFTIQLVFQRESNKRGHKSLGIPIQNIFQSREERVVLEAAGAHERHVVITGSFPRSICARQTKKL
jgi:hypothetical protein